MNLDFEGNKPKTKEVDSLLYGKCLEAATSEVDTPQAVKGGGGDKFRNFEGEYIPEVKRVKVKEYKACGVKMQSRRCYLR